jgi:transcriptional regulator GlxA family with amidase domain
LRRVIFLLLPELEILDMAGPLQAFSEAQRSGADLRILLCGPEPRVRTDQGLWLSDLEPLPEPEADDVIVVPGLRFAALEAVSTRTLAWLRTAEAHGGHLASV